VWALHNHPQRILQFSFGKLVPEETQDAYIQELKTMRNFNQLKIAVAGTGYVGLSIATLLSQHHDIFQRD
jgi:D-serine dehydratase